MFYHFPPAWLAKKPSVRVWACLCEDRDDRGIHLQPPIFYCLFGLFCSFPRILSLGLITLNWSPLLAGIYIARKNNHPSVTTCLLLGPNHRSVPVRTSGSVCLDLTRARFIAWGVVSSMPIRETNYSPKIDLGSETPDPYPSWLVGLNPAHRFLLWCPQLTSPRAITPSAQPREGGHRVQKGTSTREQGWVAGGLVFTKIPQEPPYIPPTGPWAEPRRPDGRPGDHRTGDPSAPPPTA